MSAVVQPPRGLEVLRCKQMLKTVFSDCKNSFYVKTFRLSLPWEITLINIKSIPQTSRIFIKFRFWYHMSRLNQCSGQAIYYISLFSKIRWGLTYLPTQKSDVIYECSLKDTNSSTWKFFLTVCQKKLSSLILMNYSETKVKCYFFREKNARRK